MGSWTSWWRFRISPVSEWVEWEDQTMASDEGGDVAVLQVATNTGDADDGRDPLVARHDGGIW